MSNSFYLIKLCRKFVKGNSNVLQGVERKCFSLNSVSFKNHYETLKLPNSCSSKEIREAFISLSKQYHPDKNKSNPRAQEQFVKINEAYNVLIKPESRRDYDSSLHFRDPYKTHDNSEYYRVHRQDTHYRDPWKDPSFARNRNFWTEDKTRQTRDDYYGVKGFPRVPNRDFLFWILLFTGVGLVVQIAIIRYSGLRNVATYDKMSRENQEFLDTVRERAKIYGSRENQIEEYKRRLEKSDE